MKLAKKPKSPKAKQTARDKEINEILEDADLKKFDPELLEVVPQKKKRRTGR
ncbi:MAG: hypothetical protein WAM05_00670 [Candidatus Binataceae bacterium]